MTKDIDDAWKELEETLSQFRQAILDAHPWRWREETLCRYDYIVKEVTRIRDIVRKAQEADND